MLCVDQASLAATAAEHVSGAVADAIRLRGSCALALAGGSTPRPVYERMAAPALTKRVAWERVSVFFGDERCVPPDHPASNYGMAREALLRRVPVARASVHRMEGERADRNAAARDYERELPERLDVLILGVGEDGHTASLFPHAPALHERERRVVPVRGPHPPFARLTITPPVIRAARAVLVLAAGAGKAAVVARALEGPVLPDELPIQVALGATWFIDGAAAHDLDQPPERP